MFKKTLQVELKNTLRNAPLVPDSVSSVLNKEDIPSVQNKVLACNLPEVDLLPRYRENRTCESLLYMYLEVLSSPSLLQRRRGSYSFLENKHFNYNLIFKKGGCGYFLSMLKLRSFLNHKFYERYSF